MEFKMEELTVSRLFDAEHSLCGEWLEQYEYPWEAVSDIGEMIFSIGEKLSSERFVYKGNNVWIARTAEIDRTVNIENGPLIVDEYAQIRQGAFLRGNIVIGKGAVVGNSTELKNCVLFDKVEVPHFNYVGDSILGFHAHFGAGAVTSNVKSDRSEVTVRAQKANGEKAEFPTHLKKLGAMVGDYVEVGCNSVLNPGTVLGRNTTIYPLTSVRNTIPENSICKGNGKITRKRVD